MIASSPVEPGAGLWRYVIARLATVALGPVSLSFASSVKLEEIDPVNHTARLQAQGTDATGRGRAQGTLVFRLEPSNGGSRVPLHTDLVLSGAAAQYGQDVQIVQATAARVMAQFATNLPTAVLAHATS